MAQTAQTAQIEDTDRLITVGEAAAMLSLSRNQVIRLATRGELPVWLRYPPKGVRRFRECDVLALRERAREAAQAEWARG